MTPPQDLPPLPPPAQAALSAPHPDASSLTGGSELPFMPELSRLLPTLTLGFLLGLAAGYVVKVVGRVALLLIGVVFIGVQVMAANHMVSVDWGRVQQAADPYLGNNLHPWLEAAWKTLGSNVPFGGSFAAGFLLGLRR